MTPDTIDFNSLSRKQLVELVITKYNDCFKLEEEKKTLKLIQETNENQIKNDIKERDELREENKKLKSDLSECECSMHFENDEVGYRKRECKKLKEELDKLRTDNIYEEWLYD